MISEALEAANNPVGSFLEPCVGGGAFYFAFIDLSMEKTSGNQGDLQNILDRCFIADNDELALSTVRKAAPAYFKAKYGYGLEIPQANVFLGDSLWSAEDFPRFEILERYLTNLMDLSLSLRTLHTN